MILTTAKFNDAVALMQGKRKADALLEAFRSFAHAQYGIDILDIEFKGKPGLKRLNILLSNHADMHKIGACGADGDEQVRAELTAEFRRICEEQKLADYSPADKIFISFGDIETEIKARVLEAAKQELQQAKELFPDAAITQVYAVSNAVHIFCAQEAQIKANKQSGIDNAVREYCRNAVAKYDEMQLFVHFLPIYFISEEMLAEKYENNLFTYLSGVSLHC